MLGLEFGCVDLCLGGGELVLCGVECGVIWCVFDFV